MPLGMLIINLLTFRRQYEFWQIKFINESVKMSLDNLEIWMVWQSRGQQGHVLILSVNSY